MKKDTVISIDEPETTRDALTEVLREGAQKLIAEAVQAELEELLEQYEDQVYVFSENRTFRLPG